MDCVMYAWPRWLRSTLLIDAGRFASPERLQGMTNGQRMCDRLRCSKFVSGRRSAKDCKHIIMIKDFRMRLVTI